MMKPSLALQANLALLALIACLVPLLAHAATPWDTAASQLVNQIASILGPGQVQLDLSNRSTIPAAELPAIRHALEEALRTHNIKLGSSESASALHITLSENSRERLWIAQIAEGNQTQTAIVRLDKPAITSVATASSSSIRLERQPLWISTDYSLQEAAQSSGSILAALDLNDELLLLREDQIVTFSRNSDRTDVGIIPLPRPNEAGPLPREPRGMLLNDGPAGTVTAYLPGRRCTVPVVVTRSSTPVVCQASDDPWPIASGGAAPQKAFYNAARNYFTGVLTPGIGLAGSSNAELAAFYTAAPVIVSGTPSLLLAGIDGKVRIANASGMRAITGARDWGSDLATLTTSCDTNVILTSNSGEAANDSLRAYQLRGTEAITASEPLAMNGSVMALNPSASSPKSVLVIVRVHSQQGSQQERSQDDSAPVYEVDRVSALCQ